MAVWVIYASVKQATVHSAAATEHSLAQTGMRIIGCEPGRALYVSDPCRALEHPLKGEARRQMLRDRVGFFCRRFAERQKHEGEHDNAIKGGQNEVPERASGGAGSRECSGGVSTGRHRSDDAPAGGGVSRPPAQVPSPEDIF